jgi:hypothetical protein
VVSQAAKFASQGLGGLLAGAVAGGFMATRVAHAGCRDQGVARLAGTDDQSGGIHQTFSRKGGRKSKTARGQCHRAVRTACEIQQAGVRRPGGLSARDAKNSLPLRIRDAPATHERRAATRVSEEAMKNMNCGLVEGMASSTGKASTCPDDKEMFLLRK